MYRNRMNSRKNREKILLINIILFFSAEKRRKRRTTRTTILTASTTRSKWGTGRLEPRSTTSSQFLSSMPRCHLRPRWGAAWTSWLSSWATHVAPSPHYPVSIGHVVFVSRKPGCWSVENRFELLPSGCTLKLLPGFLGTYIRVYSHICYSIY
jgi:hypothetical protein